MPPSSLPRRGLKAARDLALDMLDAARGRRDMLTPPRRLRFVGDGDFAAIEREFADHLRAYAGLDPEHRVLDVGCGIGRIAVPLVGYLSGRGAYDGFDIVPRAIRWCTRSITARDPRFRFHLANLRNRAYRPAGGASAASFRFPFADETFDIAVATSLFTHLLPAEAANYLGEIARVLKPGGRCLVTWFLRNEEAERLLREGRSAIPLAHEYGTCLVMDPAVPEAAIAYPQAEVMARYERAGFADVVVHPGSWCGRAQFVSGQDMVIAARPAPGRDARLARGGTALGA